MILSVVLAVTALCGTALSYPQVGFVPVASPHVRSEVRDDRGQFSVSYTGDGASTSQRGYLKPTPEGDYVLVQEGIIHHVAPDGSQYRTTYTADENGYRAQGPHIVEGTPI